MKICFLHHSFILGSGTDSLIYQYAKRLLDGGDQVDIICLREGNMTEGLPFKMKVEKVNIPLGNSRLVSSVFAPIPLALSGKWDYLFKRLNQFDVVVTMLYPMCTVPLMQKGRKYKWVHIEWGTPQGVWSTFTEREYAALAKWCLGYACRNADRVLVPGSFIKDWVASRYGVQATQMYLDGIDFELFDKSKYVGKDTNNILYVGRVSPHKNLEMLIRAMPSILQVRPEATLTIVGSLSFKNHLQYLLDLIHLKLKLPAGTVNFEGAVPWSKLPQYYADCSVYCSPSLWEGFLKSECYAFEKPFVAFDRTSAADMIQDRKTGLLVGSVNWENLSLGLLMLLLNKDIAQKWGSNGYSWAKENLDLNIITNNLRKELSSC